MKILVASYSKTYWCLRPFAYLFNKYWQDQDVTVLHYPPIPFDLPSNFNFFSPSRMDYPMDKWANGIIRYLESIDDKSVIIMLEDYWLTRKVDKDIVNILTSFVESDDNILRVDLTHDKSRSDGVREVGYIEWLDLVEAPESMYQMSLQASVWNRKNLLYFLNALPLQRRSSWDVELTGTLIVHKHPHIRVFGTRQNPVRYENGINVNEGINYELTSMSLDDREYIKKWIPKKER